MTTHDASVSLREKAHPDDWGSAREISMDQQPIYDVPMTRIVLGDCKAALEELRSEPAGQQWRIRWVGLLALLRTVRYAMTKVDAKSDDVHPDLCRVLLKFPEQMKETKPHREIYWRFICDDANDILHYYKFSAVHSETVPHEHDPMIRSTSRTSAMTHFIHHVDTSQKFEGQDLGQAYLMKSGPFVGRDQLDLVEEAIQWWESHIDDMIDRAKAQKE
jgi:hypothetical protein